MNRIRKLLAFVMAASMVLSLVSCARVANPEIKPEEERDYEKQEDPYGYEPTPVPSDPGATPVTTPGTYDGIVDMTMFITMAGKEKNDGNDIQELIAEKTGVRVKETWLTGQSPDEAVASIIASGKLPDFIDGSDSNLELYHNGLLVAWDDYLEMYPNLKELYTEDEWDRFRQSDGHIYWANVFGNHYKEDTTTLHNGQAFWIQTRVLEWDGYPKIETLDQYFDLLERFAAANPTLPDGTPVIPYTVLCEDWKYYCLENAPMYLDGYPSNNCVIVNVDQGVNNPKVVDYNTTSTAKRYFQKLNEEYNKGAIDPDFATQTYDEYIAKLCTGRVLGMNDQYWDFAYNIMGAFYETKYDANNMPYTLSDIGCEYVPLGLTIDKGMTQQYHAYGDEINTYSGIAVTTSCSDPALAFSFLSALLDQDVHDLRFWGVKDVDYLVDANGKYYRTEEMRENWLSDSYKAKHTCEYSYMPQWRGRSKDGVNYMMPEESPEEYLATLPASVRKCFEAYGCGNYCDFLGSERVEQGPWFPLWSWSNNLSTETPGGKAFKNMGEVKHAWLPIVVMSNNFESDWNSYMTLYEECYPQDFLAEAQAEVERRMT